jgi:hypothetical protein
MWIGDKRGRSDLGNGGTHLPYEEALLQDLFLDALLQVV